MDWLLLSNVLYWDLRLPQSCRGAVRGEKLFSLSLQTFVFIRPFFVFLVEIMRLWTSKFGLLYSVIINLEPNAKVYFLKFKHLKCRLRIFQFGHFRVKCYICLFPFLLKTLIPARCRCGFVYMDIFCVFWPIVIASTSRTRDQANAVWQNPQTQRRLESFLCINFTFLLCHKHTNIVLKPTSFRPQYCRISFSNSVHGWSKTRTLGILRERRAHIITFITPVVPFVLLWMAFHGEKWRNGILLM